MADSESSGLLNKIPIDCPVTSETFAGLLHVRNRLAEQLDYFGDDEDIRATVAAIDAVIHPEHRSLHPDRLNDPREAMWLRNWQLEQGKHPPSLLHWILSPSTDSRKSGVTCPITKRDAEVAATLIQWLGTNVGLCFVDRCLRESRLIKSTEPSGGWVGSMKQTFGKNVPSPVSYGIAVRALNTIINPDHPKWRDLAVRLAQWIDDELATQRRPIGRTLYLSDLPDHQLALIKADEPFVRYRIGDGVFMKNGRFVRDSDPSSLRVDVLLYESAN